MYQSAPADLTVNIFEKTKVLIFIDYPLCAAFGPLLCLSGGQGRSKATPANIAVYVYKMFFHSVQKLLYRLHQRYSLDVACSKRKEREEEATNLKHITQA